MINSRHYEQKRTACPGLDCQLSDGAAGLRRGRMRLVTTVTLRFNRRSIAGRYSTASEHEEGQGADILIHLTTACAQESGITAERAFLGTLLESGFPATLQRSSPADKISPYIHRNRHQQIRVHTTSTNVKLFIFKFR